DLAALHHAAERYHFAALYYEVLLQHRGLGRWTPAQLLQAALAFTTVGDEDRAGRVGRELLDRDGAGKLPGLTRVDVARQLEKARKAAALADWPLYGGNRARGGHAEGSAPLLSLQQWKIDLTRTNDTKNWLAQAEKNLTQHGQPSFTASSPLAVT